MFQNKGQSSRLIIAKLRPQTMCQLWHHLGEWSLMLFAQNAGLSLLRPDAGDMVEKLQACLLQALAEPGFIIFSQRQHKLKDSSRTMRTNPFRSFYPFRSF